MNLKQLYYFKRLAEKQHYTEAASSLFITQPSLSHAIAELEKELGVTLFEKQGRNVRITSGGMLFLPYVEKAICELEKGCNALTKLTDVAFDNVKLAFIYTMGEYVIAQLIEHFTAQPEKSNIQFSFYQGTTTSIVQDLKADKFDLAICSMMPDETDIEFTPIISQELVLVTAKNHPLAQRNILNIDLEDVAEYPFIFFSEKSGLRQFIDKIFVSKNLIPNIACYVEEDTAMVGLVGINYGIAIMPRINLLSSSNVHVINLNNIEQTRYVYLATHKYRTMSPSAQAFKEFMLRFCQENTFR